MHSTNRRTIQYTQQSQTATSPSHGKRQGRQSHIQTWAASVCQMWVSSRTITLRDLAFMP